MGRKSRHSRDESDPLLGFYSQTMAATTSTSTRGPLYDSTRSNSSHPDSSVRSGRYQHLTSPSQNNNSNVPNHSIASQFPGEPSALTKQSSDQSTRPLNKLTGRDNHNPSTSTTRPRKKHGYRVHRVSYTAQNHVQVLFQMYGSAFPQVLPFCILNIAWTLVVFHLKTVQAFDLTFHSSVGHSFMGLLVSFLVVSRSKISYDRFMDFRRNLAKSYKACREIAQYATVFTLEAHTVAAQQWRRDVCYRTILLLRVTMDALLWSSTERDRWEDEFYKLREHEYRTDIDDNEEEEEDEETPQKHFFQFRSLTHGRRSMIDEHFRAPITIAHCLRQTIMEHPVALGYKLAVNEYRDLLNFVSVFLDAYHEFRVLVFTPYPFPLVQMTRAFLFVWVYTLPMVLLKEYRLWSSLLIVLLVSFGFVGIEYVSMALDDPFGDDTNDVDEHGMALLVYEDIYLTLYRTDGYKAALELREQVLARYKQGRGLDCYRDDMLNGYEVWESSQLRHRSSPKPKPTQHDATTIPASAALSRLDNSMNSNGDGPLQRQPKPPR